MPIKPGKDETESDWMARCVPDMMGESGGTKRPQDQAVAACAQMWRDAHSDAKSESRHGDDAKQLGEDGEDELDPPDPDDDESHEDFMDRCVEELTDGDEDVDEDDAREACQIAWEDYRSARAARTASGVHHKTHAEEVHDMEFVLSDETVDRMGDVISADGWDLTSFNKNPIALFNHTPFAPIGVWRDVHVEDRALRGRLQLAPEGTSPRIDEIRRLVEAGILRAVSVGFREIESESRKDAEGRWAGYHFLRQELIETSLVSVPANPNALAIAKSLRISPQTLDLVFAKQGNRDPIARRGFAGKHAKTSPSGKGSGMSSLAQRIQALEAQLVETRDALQAHLDQTDDSNVSDADLQKTRDFNATIVQLENTRAALVDSEKALGQTADNGTGTGNGRSRADDSDRRLWRSTRTSQRQQLLHPAAAREEGT